MMPNQKHQRHPPINQGTHHQHSGLSAEWLSITLHSIGDAVIATDNQGRVTFMNPVAESLTGWTADEAAGQPLERVFQIVHEETGKPVENPAAKALRDGVVVGLANHTLLIAKDGTRRAIDDSAAPIQDDEGQVTGVVLVFRDISEKREAERRRNARLAVTQILAEETALEKAVADILSALCATLEWDAASYWRLEPEENLLRCQNCWVQPNQDLEEFQAASMELAFQSGESLPGRAWESQKPVWVADVAVEPGFRRATLAQKVGLHGGFACPVMTGNKILGVLECFLGQVQQPDEDLLEMMATISGQMGHFIERRLSEQKLRLSEEMLADFFENASVGLNWLGSDGTILRANQAELDLLGYDREEFIGQHIAEFHVDPDAAEEMLRRLNAGEPLHNYEARVRRKDGSIRDVLIDANVLWEGDRFVHTRFFTRDISERKRAEHALRESEQRFRTLADAAPVLIWMSGPNKEGSYFNQTWLTFTGKSAEEQKGDGWLDLVHPEDRDELYAICLEGFRNQTPFNAEFRMRRADGEYRWLLDTGTPRFDPDGRFAGFIGSCIDITERKQAEEAVRQSQERLEIALEASGAVPWGWTAQENQVDEWTPQFRELFGFSPDEPASFDKWSERVHPDDRERLKNRLKQIQNTPGDDVWDEEFRIIHPQKGVRWIAGLGRCKRDASGQVLRMMGVNFDITQRKQTELALKFLAEASQSLSALVDYKSTLQKVAHLAVPDFADWCLVDMLNDKGIVQRVAVAHVDPSKMQLAEDLYRRYPPDWEASRGAMKVLRTCESDMAHMIEDELLVKVAWDEEHLRTLRELKPTSYMCVPLRAKERILGVMTFVFAESGRRYSPDDLALAEDLARRATIAIENARLYQEVQEAHRRKDEFLAMLAHELRNPLAPIRSGLDILAMDDATDKEMIGVMQEQVEHVVRLVDDLLDVSRIMRGRIELRKEAVELSALVKQSVEAVRPLIDMNEQEFVVRIPEMPIWLKADPVRIVQVFVNLLTNASKYTDSGGRIEFTAEEQQGEVVIRVQDTGVGIEPELMPMLFELFTQSTRSLDRAKGGLGIGLTLVQRLVELHGGAISAFSEGPGQGSTFTVRLPVSEAVPQPQKPVEPVDLSIPRRIVVVDDNVGAAHLLSKLLHKLGDHEVITAHEGATALAKIKELHPEIVLLDIGLPGMNGYEVATVIRQMPEFDDVLLVALTGYGQKEDRRKSKESGFDEHQVKPPSVEQMKAILTHPKLRKKQPEQDAAVIHSREPALPPSPTASSKVESQPESDGAADSASLDLRQFKHDLGNVGYVLSLVGETFLASDADAELVQRAKEALEQEVATIHRLVERLQTAIDEK